MVPDRFETKKRMVTDTVMQLGLEGTNGRKDTLPELKRK
jgi:hypothetical protein